MEIQSWDAAVFNTIALQFGKKKKNDTIGLQCIYSLKLEKQILTLIKDLWSFCSFVTSYSLNRPINVMVYLIKKLNQAIRLNHM